jgi:4-amino-4-deoxy-L-arabinose transferase-like glycosyltransferase
MDTSLTSPPPVTFFGRWRTLTITGVIIVFAIGLAVRMINFNNPPLDTAVRQLRSFIVARGMYYQIIHPADSVQSQKAIELWYRSEVLEPQIFERLVALSYVVVGGEKLWVPRLYSILFWLTSGGSILLLAKRMTNLDGAMVSLAFFLMAPLGISFSRKFQPDSLMIMGILLTILAVYHWEEKKTWKMALLAGILGGLAILIKITAIFFVAGATVALVFTSRKFKQVLRDPQVWVMAALMIFIPFLYYLLDIRARSSGYFTFWNLSFANLLTQPSFYIRWMENLNNLIGILFVLIALSGVILTPLKGRTLLVGLWGGYFLYGLAFPYQIHTHDYYNLILIPIIALSLASIGQIVFEKLFQSPAFWQVAFLGVALFSMAIPFYQMRSELINDDYRGDWGAWRKIGKELPTDGQIIALTNEYGLRVEYFGLQKVATWPAAADFQMMRMREENYRFDFNKFFADNTKDKAYFLVTLFNELDAQPELKAKLNDNYPIYADGEGYLIYDLRHPLNPPLEP